MLAEGTVNTGSIEVTNDYGESNDVPIPNFIDNPCAVKKGYASCMSMDPGPPLYPLWQKEKEQKGEFSSMQVRVRVLSAQGCDRAEAQS
jgi:hypothetical protein